MTGDEAKRILDQIGWSSVSTIFMSLNLTEEQCDVIQRGVAAVSTTSLLRPTEDAITIIISEWLQMKGAHHVQDPD